jgi:predicted HNH restriction endonuclease
MQKSNWKLIPVIAVVLCSACNKQAAPIPTSASSSAKAIEEPAFKIAEEQRRALEKAKQVEQDLQKAADQQKRAIEAATSGN